MAVTCIGQAAVVGLSSDDLGTNDNSKDVEKLAAPLFDKVEIFNKSFWPKAPHGHWAPILLLPALLGTCRFVAA